MHLKKITQYRWKEIILALTSISENQLKNKHQPCPFCGGKDRYRFDDKNGGGTWYCNQACGPNQKQSGNGFSFLMNYFSEDFRSVAKRIEKYLGGK